MTKKIIRTSVKIILAALLVTALFNINAAEAKSIKSFFMPGPVISGHAKYESECSNCHRSFSKESQKSLCLDCHKKIALDIKKGRGYHSKDKRARNTKCQQCHKEHKGREYKAVIFDVETFDHKFTDFPLKYRHFGAKCGKCHKKDKKYREAPVKCYTCHKEEDTHKGRLGKDCKECHDSRSWTEARFDHKKTDFPLKYRHKKASCAACHPGGRFKKTPRECLSCHRINDVHNGKYGKKCGDCHKANDWKKFNFDHEKTDFPLRFRHKKVDCHACHKGKFYKDQKLAKTCYGCHKNDDEHKGRYGKKCKTCHSPREWGKTKFNHDKTDFPLKDGHRDVACVKCHQGKAYGVKEVRICSVCHKKDDVHRGREGRDCEQCHNQKSWSKGVVFDHDLTKFPLIGLHAVTLCEQCHNRGDYKQISVRCFACHKSDDKHEEGLGKLCGDCHNPNGWRIWRFKHSRDTEYTLGGAHTGLDCAACHKRKLWKKIAKPDNCFSCHQDDDIHRGGFGLNCIRCHSTKSFKDIKIRH